jgi:hypothetical protein
MEHALIRAPENPVALPAMALGKGKDFLMALV